MRKIDWKTIFNVVMAMFGIGLTGVSFTLTPYTMTLNPILLIGGVCLITLGLYRLSSETK